VALTRYPAFPGFNAKMFEEARLAPLVQPLKQSVTGDLGTVLWLLMGMVGMVLLIACANVANLLLVRVEGRQHELSIRAALGAGRGQIARELLLESVTLGVLGGVVGLGLAFAALKLLVAIAPANLPRMDQIAIDGSVLLFTLLVSIVAGALFGAIPVLKYAGPRVGTALRSEGRALTQSRERHRARSTLVVVQVALALVLLIGSGLMIRTFQALKQVKPGFDRPDQVQTLRISIPSTLVRDPVAAFRMEQSILDRIAAIAGVRAAGLTTVVPLDNDRWQDPVFAEDHTYTDTQIPRLRTFKFISPGCWRRWGIRSSRAATSPGPISTTSGRWPWSPRTSRASLWQEPSAAIGKRIRESLKAPWREVVGVVGDERDDGSIRRRRRSCCGRS
jgi:predicted permease